jgi:hypothetical protein
VKCHIHKAQVACLIASRLSLPDESPGSPARRRGAGGFARHRSRLQLQPAIQLDTTPPPLISLVNTNVDESAGVATVLVALDHACSQTVSARFSTSDGPGRLPVHQ